MAWNALTLVTDADLGAYEPEAIAPGKPWGQTTWLVQRSAAKRDLKVWLELAYPSVPGVADRVLDRWAPEWVFGYTGSTYTDYTSQARDDQTEDLPIATVFTTAASDRLYVGAAWAFDGLVVTLLDSLNAVASVLTAKYWGPTGWTAFPATTDGTIAVSGKTLSGTGRVTWTLPLDWERRPLNGTGDEYYWVELSVSVAVTAGTALTQLLAIRPSDGLKACAARLALSYICRGLSLQSPVPQQWLDRATAYADTARRDFDTLKVAGLLPIDTGSDEAITPGTETGPGTAQTVRLQRG